MNRSKRDRSAGSDFIRYKNGDYTARVGVFEERLISGVVVRIDWHLNQIKLAGGDGEEEWISVPLILSNVD
jgi:hypothetical protein